MGILESFSDILTYSPGETNAKTHVITLSNNTLVRHYSIPLHYEETIKTELTRMLNASIIEHSDSAYSEPLLPLRRKMALEGYV